MSDSPQCCGNVKSKATLGSWPISTHWPTQKWPGTLPPPHNRANPGCRLENAMTQDSLPPDHALARRTVLKGASLGVGAGLMSGLTAAAQAQTTGTGVAQAEDGPIWSAEYWAKKGDVSLNLWRKRVGAPKPGEPPLPLLFLVHGSSNSARSSYDLTLPGKGEYSFMNVFARYGYERLDHGSRRLWVLRQFGEQFRHRQ